MAKDFDHPEHTLNIPRFPARYQLQRCEVATAASPSAWSKVGNGCHEVAPLIKRMARLVYQSRLKVVPPQFRVWDTHARVAVAGRIEP